VINIHRKTKSWFIIYLMNKPQVINLHDIVKS